MAFYTDGVLFSCLSLQGDAGEDCRYLGQAGLTLVIGEKGAVANTRVVHHGRDGGF